MFAWGDNDHGQQGNGTTIVNRKPVLVHGLEEVKVNRVACGSSHSLAWTATHPSTASLHEPVLFATGQDPLGSSALGIDISTPLGSEETSTNTIQTTVPQQTLAKLPAISLATLIISLDSMVARQQSLQHVLAALQIIYSREAVVAALTNHVVGHPSLMNLQQTSSETMASSTADDEDAEIALGGGEAPAAANAAEAAAAFSPRLSPESEQHSLMIAFPSLSCSSSASLSSKISPSALSVIAATITSHAQVIGPQEEPPQLAPDIDEFTGLLDLNDAHSLVDLLKLGVAGRSGPHASETLADVLIALSNTSVNVRDMLLELCVTELEDEATSTHALRLAPQPVTQESTHPYVDDSSIVGHVKIPGAKGLKVRAKEIIKFINI